MMVPNNNRVNWTCNWPSASGRMRGYSAQSGTDAHRWKRLTQHIVDRGYGGLLMFDPLNIRYATDSTNMQLWNTHNPFRAVYCAGWVYGVWDYKNSPFLSEFNPLVREQLWRGFVYFDRGDKVDVAQTCFQTKCVLMEEHAGDNKRLAVDKIMLHGLRALGAGV